MDQPDPLAAPGTKTVLDRLCKALVAEKSYAVLALPEGDGVRLHGVEHADGFAWPMARIPELAPLSAHFDRILVRTDGYGFEVLCIKERLTETSRAVSLGLDELRDVGRQCLGYTGKMHGTQMPVVMTIWEVCSEANAGTDHLRDLRCLPMRQKVAVSAWSLRPEAGTVWTNLRFNGRLAGRGYVEALLRSVTGAEPSARPRAAMGDAARSSALTYVLLAAIAVMFALQLALGDFEGLLAPTIGSLIASGALDHNLVADGQWYRLVTAAFLHSDLLHVGLNAVGLYIAGVLLETMVGRAWLLTIFGLSTLGGSAASLLINDASIVSVGASGAIMGMLAAAFFLTLRLPYGQARTAMQTQLLYWLVPALLPLATSRSAGKIDFAAHFGGALVGGVIGWILYKTWRDADPLPRFGRAARAAAVGVAVMIVASLGFAFAGRASLQRSISLAQLVAPDEDYKKLGAATPEQLEVQLRELRAKYPRDPRTSLFSALAAIDANAKAEAERYLRSGLAERELLEVYFENGALESAMRARLAQLLLERGADDDARQAFRPACAKLKGAAPEGLSPAWVASVCT